MNKETADNFANLAIQLHSFYTEMSTLSKKSADSPLNKFKLKFINQTVNDINLILGDQKPFEDFENFNTDDMPTNSDVTMILSQYLKSTAKFYRANTRVRNGTRYLIENDKITEIQVERLHILEVVYN